LHCVGAVEPPAAPAAIGHVSLLIAGDQLRIEVFDNPELTTSARIGAEGTIAVPLIGAVTAIGRAPEQIAKEVQARLEDGYLRKAATTVTVVEYGPRLVYVMGAVLRQDAVPLNPFAETLALQVIGKAGGFTEDANRRSAQVIRDDPAHPGLKRALSIPSGDTQESLAKDVLLEPGDIILVPRQDRVYVVGRVKTAGAQRLPAEGQLTVSKAITLAGGFDLYARQDQVQVVRDGKTVAIVDVRGILGGVSKAEDPPLAPGDTIFVPEGRF
ncbi:MAG: polysaccharide biosynthesis/export family protein, partial [Planctomycetes bacterium]|nr:polysaccharide biosynthesis/export family protein [Planctomycetota bacterium]